MNLPRPAGDPGRRCWFILTTGRSGSSLLSAVLAHAGADFGLPVPSIWDADRGVLEHPQIILAARYYRRGFDALHGRSLLSPRLEAALYRARARRRLRRALAAANFFKIGDLDLVVQPAFRLGCDPRVILSYRRFEPNATSLLVGRTYDPPESLARDYVRLYRNGLSLLDTFGGCVVAYDELMHAPATALRALAGVTGLEAGRLEAAYAALARPRERVTEPAGIVHTDAQAVFAELERRRGQVVEPSAQALRKLARRSDPAPGG